MSQDITVAFVPGPDDDLDAVELDRLARALREEIRQLDEVDSVDQAIEGEAPEGTRAVDVAAIGELIVGAAQGVTALTAIIETVRAWFARRAAATPTPPPTLKVYDRRQQHRDRGRRRAAEGAARRVPRGRAQRTPEPQRAPHAGGPGSPAISTGLRWAPRSVPLTHSTNAPPSGAR